MVLSFPRMVDFMSAVFRYFCRILLLGTTIAGIILFIFDCLRFLVISSDFDVQEITIEGNERINEEIIKAKMGITQGTNIWLVDLEELAKRLESIPAIRSVGVQRIPPRRIHLTIEERSTIAMVLNPNDGFFYGIDQDGVVLPPIVIDTASSSTLEQQENMKMILSSPLLSGEISVPFELGKPVADPQVISVIQFLVRIKQNVPGFFSEVAETECQIDGNINIHPRRRIGVLVLRDLNSPELEKKIAAFWHVLEKENLRAIYVDARFPDKGFAVRWDENDQGRWKQLYTSDRSNLVSLRRTN